jgi:hypothetical protein
MQKDTHLFAIRTATMWQMWGRGSNLGQSTFQGENPEPGAYIHYYLSDAAAARARGEMAGESDDSPDTDGGAMSASPGAARSDGGVRIRITDSNGALVREISDNEARAGINRVVWDMAWSGPEGAQGGGFGGRGGGPSGPNAVPGRYTATLLADGQELSSTFEVRGDPNVGASMADHTARFEAARRAAALQSQVAAMIEAMSDLDSQIEGTLDAIDGKSLPNEAAIRQTAGEATERLGALSDQTNRPPDGMNYRDWPRIAEQLGFVARGINGAQARPTQGQLEVLELVEQVTQERAAELDDIIQTVIGELNRLLDEQPKVLTSWRRTQVIS